MEDSIFTDNGKIKVIHYTLKLTNSTHPDFDEIPFEDVNNIQAVVDNNGNPGFFIEFYDSEFCCNTSTECDSIDIQKTTTIL